MGFLRHHKPLFLPFVFVVDLADISFNDIGISARTFFFFHGYKRLFLLIV